VYWMQRGRTGLASPSRFLVAVACMQAGRSRMPCELVLGAVQGSGVRRVAPAVLACVQHWCVAAATCLGFASSREMTERGKRAVLEARMYRRRGTRI
jgi:hypothetical protein